MYIPRTFEAAFNALPAKSQLAMTNALKGIPHSELHSKKTASKICYWTKRMGFRNTFPVFEWVCNNTIVGK